MTTGNIRRNWTRDHTTSAIFDSTFKAFENTRIRSARFFQPSERYLAEHRELLVG